MTIVLAVLIGGVMVVGILAGGFAWAVRESVSKGHKPSVHAEVRPDPARIEVAVTVPLECRGVRIEAMTFPRMAEEELGARPPAGFHLTRHQPVEREAFEPDLEELAALKPFPSEEVIEAETAAQYEEWHRLVKAHEAACSTFQGAVKVRPGETRTFLISLNRAGVVDGGILITYSQRSGFWRFTSGVNGRIEGARASHL